MRIIRKTISLEPFKSRVPSIIDSVSYVGDTFEEILPRIKDGTFPNGNYSLCPSDIEIPQEIASSITFPTNISVLIPSENGYERISFDTQPYHYVDESGITEIYYNDTRKKYLSFGGLMKWYRWFNDYYFLLNHPSCRKHTYTSIEEYEKVELGGYVTEEFEEYVEQFEAMGGDAMYRFIVEKCIPRLDFSGNTKMIDYWGTSFLYYPQCVSWYGWFSERHDKYGSFTDVTNCSESSDCCDCKEYFDRGGNEMYEMLKNFIESVEPCNAEIGEASITIPILITRSIDDMGEFSILCNEYELGRKYISGNSRSADLSVIDGDVKYLASGIGFQYDTCYSDMKFDENGWKSYIDEILDYQLVTTLDISGTTSSKLHLFDNTTVSYDDVGNRLDYAINVPRNAFRWENDTNYTLTSSTPYTFSISQNMTLPLPYEIGSVNHLEFIEDDGEKEYYFGNILTNITFSAVDASGNTHTASTFNYNGDTIAAINSLGENLIKSDTLNVAFNYNIGCIIEKKKNGYTDWYPYSASTTHHNGVEYTESRRLVRKQGKYNLDSQREALIYYYITEPLVVSVEASDYGGENKMNVAIANFNVKPIDGNDSYFDKYNGFTISPMTKEEYKFGSSSFEKVEGDIYIERGNAASFEKHLKLMEINSLEALEQYSNGNVFKINNDSK